MTNIFAAEDISRVRGAGAKVLLVEDEPLVQMLTAVNLEELGFVVETAASAKVAREKLDALNGQVSALVVDVGLPDARGDAFVAEMLNVYPGLRALLATGYDEGPLRARFSECPSIAVLRKPYTLEQLRASLLKINAMS